MGIRIDELSFAPVVLAPMSGVTDLPFRRLVKRLGAGLVVSEMIASQSMIRQTKESLKLSSSTPEEFPMAVQLAGHEPDVMAEAARLNADRGAAIIDINFGCPVKKVVNKLAGSAMMREPVLAGRIMAAVVKAVDLPVTMKMRLGWDDECRNAPELARIARDCGVRLLTVHGRTRCQLYNGSADWRAVRATVEATDLPVLVNGDIDSLEAIDLALAQSGAAGVMVGRGAQGRPWFLRQAIAWLTERCLDPDPSLPEQRDILLEHYDALLSHHGRVMGNRIARKHLAWYVAGLTGANEFRRRINRAEDPGEVRALVQTLYDRASQVGASQVGASQDSATAPEVLAA
ncbi:tRNA dihydrouridine synthase DusB [Algihabitans albus]|uniref:tRNA dihydrouridine synthase DusB n=1 Tax=Algihabitans albus TaxID=2164067 RepID=UPI000E5D3771|nr:tRNA dihydrouridine synthase DusB [Algihabitans albus]